MPSIEGQGNCDVCADVAAMCPFGSAVLYLNNEESVRASQPGVEVECQDVTASVNGSFITYSSTCVFPSGNLSAKLGKGVFFAEITQPQA